MAQLFRFYVNFAAAYGTMWLILLVAAIALRTHIDTGIIGFFGFPVIAFIVAALCDYANQPLRNQESGRRIPMAIPMAEPVNLEDRHL